MNAAIPVIRGVKTPRAASPFASDGHELPTTSDRIARSTTVTARRPVTMSVALSLLAAHALGDFPLQPTAMAREKFENPWMRLCHAGIHGALALLFLAPVTGRHSKFRPRSWSQSCTSKLTQDDG